LATVNASEAQGCEDLFYSTKDARIALDRHVDFGLLDLMDTHGHDNDACRMRLLVAKRDGNKLPEWE
jgi:hypothetical protein